METSDMMLNLLKEDHEKKELDYQSRKQIEEGLATIDRLRDESREMHNELRKLRNRTNSKTIGVAGVSFFVGGFVTQLLIAIVKWWG